MTRTWGDFEGRADEIEEQAAEWVARIDLHGTPEVWSALEAWLNTSPRHRAVFLRLSVAWRRADELKKLASLSGVVDPDLLGPLEPSEDDAEEDPAAITANPLRPDEISRPTEHATGRNALAPNLRLVSLSEKPMSSDNGWAATRAYRSHKRMPARDDAGMFMHEVSGRRGRLRALATSRLAASVAIIALIAAGGLGAWYTLGQGNTQTYTTQIGEFRRVMLADGSAIALNTDSEVRVHYSSHSRHVDLTRGEALFQVAKDKEKPFDVEAGNTTVVAVGTAFSVRLHESGTNERVDVVVSEGRIAINPPSAQTYTAGSVATVQNGRVDATVVAVEDITSKLAWTSGRLMFQGEKLSDVVAEINRYNVRKLVVADADIAGLKIGGTFQATDPEGFARALSISLGINSKVETQPSGDEVIALERSAH